MLGNMFDWYIIFGIIILDVVTSEPTTAVTYTLYGVHRSWNMARATCEAHGQSMLKLDTPEKLHNFNVYRILWENDNYLVRDIWTGLHQDAMSNFSVSTMSWYDCDPLGVWLAWDTPAGEPDRLDTEQCVRLTKSGGKFRTRSCSTTIQVVCQYETGTCVFEEFKDMTVLNLTLDSRQVSTLDECQQACLDLSTDSGECVVFTFSGKSCYLYNGTSVYVQSHPQMTEKLKTSAYVKRCVHGVYEPHASQVANNTGQEPIRDCPIWTTTSSPLSTSPDIVASSTIIPSASAQGELEQPGLSSDVLHTSSESLLLSEYISFGLLSPSLLLPSSEGPTALPAKPTSLETAMISDSSSSASSVYGANINVSGMTSVLSGKKSKTILIPTKDAFTDANIIQTSSQILMDSTNIIPTSNNTLSIDITPKSKKNSMASINIIPTATQSSDYDQMQTSLMYNNSLNVRNLPGKDRETKTLCGCVCMERSEMFNLLYNALKNFNNKSNLSSYRRSKCSAEDDRLSAKVIGTSGIGIIVIFILLIVCMDIDRIAKAYDRRSRF